MTHETMTVHQALSELKVLDARIERATSAVFINTKKHSADTVDGIPVAEYEKTLKANLQRAEDLIRRKNAIKRAVSLSNAKAEVTIGGKLYTVAEAIYMKQHGNDSWSLLFGVLQRQYATCVGNASSHAARLEDRANQYITSIYGNSDTSKAGDEVAKLREEFISAQTLDIIDPNELGTKKLHELETALDAFEAEVDAALSVSNALTTIEIEY